MDIIVCNAGDPSVDYYGLLERIHWICEKCESRNGALDLTCVCGGKHPYTERFVGKCPTCGWFLGREDFDCQICGSPSKYHHDNVIEPSNEECVIDSISLHTRIPERRVTMSDYMDWMNNCVQSVNVLLSGSHRGCGAVTLCVFFCFCFFCFFKFYVIF